MEQERAGKSSLIDLSADRTQDIQLSRNQSRQRTRRAIGIFVLSTVIIGALVLLYLRYQLPVFTQRIHDELSTIADLKTSQIANWYAERSGDAEQILKSPMRQKQAIRYITNPSDAETGREILDWMQMRQQLDNYAAFHLFDLNGKELISSPPLTAPLTLSHNKYIEACRDSAKIIFADIHRDVDKNNQVSKEIHVSFWIPVLDAQYNGGKPAGFWSLRIDPKHFLFPMVQSWPVKSRTAETLLVRREGNDVVFLNELRHQKDTAVKLKREINSNPQMPSVMAVSGKTGVVEGISYRGNRVLAAIRQVPGTPWFMVAQIDKKEVYQPVRRISLIVCLTLLLLLISIALTIGFITRKRDALALKKQLQLEQEKAGLLAESAFLAGLLNESAQPFVSGGLDGSFITCNPAYLDLIGYSAEELKSINYLTDLTPPEWRDYEQQRVDELLRTGVAARYEKEYIRKNGERIAIDIVVNTKKNALGEVEFLYGFIRNISERKEAEKALRISEHKFRNVFENSQIGISLTLPDGTLNANNAFCQMLGYTHTELEKNFSAVTHPDDIIRTQKILKSMLIGETGQVRFNKRFIHKNGSIVCADVSTFLQRDEQNKPEFFITMIQDITQQRATETALQESEERFRLMVEHSPIGIYMFSGDEQRAEYVNPTFTRFFGYSLDEVRYTRDWWPLAYPDEEYRKQVIDEWTQKTDIAMNNQTSMEPMTTIVACKDGSQKYVSWGFVSTGTINWAFCMDMTDWKKAEEDLVRINRVYAIISQVNQMVVRTRDKNLLYQGLCEIAIEFGKFRMAWIGEVDVRQQTVKPVMWAGHEDGFLSSIQNVSALDIITGHGPTGTAVSTGKWSSFNEIQPDAYTESWKKEARLRGYNSSISFPIIVNAQVMAVFTVYSSEKLFFTDSEIRLLDEVTGDLAFAIEMLEIDKIRRLSDEALKESERRLHATIDNAPFGAHTYELMPDDRLVLIGANLSSDVILQIDTQALLGLDLLEAFPGNIDTGLDVIYRNVARGGDNYIADQVAYDDGKLAGAFEIHAMNIGNNRMTVFFRDITEKKRAEDALKHLNEELEHRVLERTVQLETANKEMEAFSYSVSHDLRSPLRSIDGWSQILKEDYESELDEQAKQYIQKIRQEAQHMGQLIDALLELSHISRTEIRSELVNLSAIAVRVADRLRENEPDRIVKFIIEPSLTAPGDSRLLEVVLSNLLGNAWKFTGSRPAAIIEFGKMEMPDSMAFFVRDNGVGFDGKNAKKLFGAFQRMHRPSEFPGTGIGLATVQRIIHSHGGEAWAEAVVDQGATFYFTLGD